VPLRFINVPGMRWKSLGRQYAREAALHARQWKPDVLVTYNAEPYYCPGIRGLGGHNIPWVPIILDGDDSTEGWEGLATKTALASAGVFLSYAACKSSPFPKTFHLDGGIRFDPLPDDPAKRQQPIVLYAGSRGPWAGVDLLLDAWQSVRTPGALLWICGQGRSEKLDRAAANDSRVVDHGVVPEARLRELMAHATVLVNPRPPEHMGNTINFPSKVLDYLGTGKPVVSTWTESMEPAYREALIVAAPATPTVLAGCLDDVLGWSERRRDQHRTTAAAFCRRHGDWQAKAAGLADWLRTVVDAPPRGSGSRVAQP